ncbi:multiheme c-type cytochrome [Candidatus Leptofilum sp.]|uniref:multiheme c-type cytochrome n=1 Tax=Candidatus Leptofilum sp. TaxID=3241576 RepID=UPI003B5CF746
MFKRIIMGVTFALLLGIMTFAATKAQTDPEVYGSDDCGECHEAVTAQWENSVHGHASVVEGFLAAWAEANSPPECLSCHTTGFDPTTGTYEKEGVACETCHPSDPAEHPQKIMQTDISSRLCGQCHTDTFAEWETSVHGQEELTCARCHNPHSNALRVGSMQDTCRTCHKEETHFFTFTTHADEGLLCTDCHLAAKSEPLGNGHSQISHTFSIGSETCTACHNEEMHMPGGSPNQAMGNEVMMEASILPADSVESQDNISTSQPSPSSPYNFAILAALIGMAFGLVGSPWLEKWQAKLRVEKDGVRDEC